MSLKIRYISFFILSLGLLGAVHYAVNFIESKAQPLYSYENTMQNQGVYSAYYTNGQLKLHEEYDNGVKEGVTIVFNEEGDTTSYHHYKGGRKDGLARYFTSSGILVLEEIYKEGYLSKEVIVNDSLYAYDYRRKETGLTIFKKACMDCHSSNKEVVGFSDELLSFEKLDSIHLCGLDSLFTPEQLTDYMSVNINELKAMEDYALSLKKSENKRFNKYLVNRNKKKKIVHSSTKNK